MKQAPSSDNSSEVILCVDVRSGELPPSIETLMGDHRFDLVHCDSVYEAMARIETACPIIVLVRVDWMSTSEFEFFSICNRSYPQLCVFVLGHDRSQAKIDRAIECGAVARLSADTIAEMVGAPDTGVNLPEVATESENNSDTFASPDNELDVESEARIPWFAEDAATESDFEPLAGLDNEIDSGFTGGIEPVGESLVGESSVTGEPYLAPEDPAPENSALGGQELLDGSGVEEADCSHHDGDSETTLPVMVPWASSDRPSRRIPPKRVRPTQSEEARPGASQVENADDDPPLLSPEELNLLLRE